MSLQSAQMLTNTQAAAIKVMVVDDAVVVRGLLSRWLIDEGGFEVVATCRSALEALEMQSRAQPDVIVLDVEMPDVDGLTALPLLLGSQPDVGVIVMSSLGATQADLALRCLERGAMDFIAKPTSNRDVTTSADFRRDIIQRIGALGRRIQRRMPAAASPPSGQPEPVASPRPSTPILRAPPTALPPIVSPPVLSTPAPTMRAASPRAAASTPHSTITPHAAAMRAIAAFANAPAAPALVCRPAVPQQPPAEPTVSADILNATLPQRSSRRPSILVIGASTGGPTAVMALLVQIKPVIRRIPVVIVQHMPAAFTPIFAEHVKRHTDLEAHEVRDRELIIPGTIYVAPGGRHLRLDGQRGGIRGMLADDAPVNFSKPSVDVLFESAARTLGASVIGVVLTGMGSDGAAGATAIHAAGGSIFAQDEASSVVWGMPGAVFRTGVCAGVGTAPEIGAMLGRLVGLGAVA